MSSLPPRIDGFLNCLSAISNGQYEQGGLSIQFPAQFDRNDLEVIWYQGPGKSRSGGFFAIAGLDQVAQFFDCVLWDPNLHFVESRRQVSIAFLDLLKQEFAVGTLEIWYNNDGMNASLVICLEPGETESWLELFWSVD